MRKPTKQDFHSAREDVGNMTDRFVRYTDRMQKHGPTELVRQYGATLKVDASTFMEKVDAYDFGNCIPPLWVRLYAIAIRINNSL